MPAPRATLVQRFVVLALVVVLAALAIGTLVERPIDWVGLAILLAALALGVLYLVRGGLLPRSFYPKREQSSPPPPERESAPEQPPLGLYLSLLLIGVLIVGLLALVIWRRVL